MLNLTSEQAVLLQLLRGETPQAPSVDWKAVFREAEKQAVPLMLRNNPHIPPEVQKALSSRLYHHTLMNMRALFAISEMNRVISGNGFRYVILKGLAAASYYPEYFARVLGDVDFLIEREEQTNVEAALTSAGYQKWNTPHICHVLFQKKNQNFEMHFEIAGIPHGEPGKLVRQYMTGVLDQPDTFSVDGTAYSIPKAKYHGLILLLHMQHHMLSEGIGLRHLFDWCCFVDKTVEDDFWNTDLLPLLQKIGLFQYAKVMTRVGALYLHTAEPEWCKDVDEALCDAVMNDILSGGNFGRKNKERAVGGIMISDHGKEGTKHGKIFNLWQTMTHAVWAYWPIVKKAPILYAAFIPAFLLRRGYRIITGQRTPLYKSIKYANERRAIYRQLRVFETED